MENSALNTPVGAAQELDSSNQMVGSTPPQDRRTSGMGERTEARLTPCTGPRDCVKSPQSPRALQLVEGVCPPLPWTGGYQTLMDTPLQVRLRATSIGCRGSRERKWLAPTRLDMPIFKWTDPGAEVTYMLWCFNVDAFLK